MQSEGIKVKINSKQFGCLYDIGNIKQSRKVTKKKCLTSGEFVTSLDSIETGDITLKTSYDPTDTAGQGEAESVFESGADAVIEIELPDTAGNNGTTFKWDKAKISELDINPDDDGEVTATFTLAVGSKPTVIAAS